MVSISGIVGMVRRGVPRTWCGGKAKVITASLENIKVMNKGNITLQVSPANPQTKTEIEDKQHESISNCIPCACLTAVDA